MGLEFPGQPPVGYSGDTVPGSDLDPSMYPPPSDGQGGFQGAFFPPPSQPAAVGFSQPYPPPAGGVPVYPDAHDSASKPIPKPRQNQLQMPTSQESYAPSTGPQPELTFVQFQQAAKLSRYAASALDYEDVPTAIMNLNKALKLLQTGKES